MFSTVERKTQNRTHSRSAASNEVCSRTHEATRKKESAVRCCRVGKCHASPSGLTGDQPQKRVFVHALHDASIRARISAHARNLTCDASSPYRHVSRKKKTKDHAAGSAAAAGTTAGSAAASGSSCTSRPFESTTMRRPRSASGTPSRDAPKSRTCEDTRVSIEHS